MASAKHVSKVNKVAKPQMIEVEPPLQGPPDPDTYGGAKHVSRINRAAQPQSPSPPRNPMELRGYAQRRGQSPQRFIEAGTQGMFDGSMAEAIVTADWGTMGTWATGAAFGALGRKSRKDKQIAEVKESHRRTDGE